ncbi:MAG TPA: protein phosphatase 2C domain-containing protein [bacterium]|nr:protein phosphatase 2C domain-containing protein [bacterium]HMW37731.1 protein phosphatase 2C domain-containing protein [bacterium]HMZ03561.1 protein phosphatase 2C domain-containing protein [bacterium]HNB58318.1 protein phosphatase 2C domain-containing protein [bacterium]HND78749.1 protein phosphatase 2C domain-containing protein [bacterium]
MQLRVASITDRGLNPSRTHNEDSFFTGNQLYIVADGLGGELAGEVASQMTIEKFNEWFPDATRESANEAGSELAAIERTVKRVNAYVYQEAQKPEFKNMGSTLSILYFFRNHALIGHVGDSKIYRVRNGKTEQLSHDQSMVQQLLDKGIITTEQAKRHPMRNVLLSCIAHKPDIDVFTYDTDIQNGDFYLLCSDGVSEYVGHGAIAEMAGNGFSGEEICATIKNIVYAGGAMDNMTAIVIFVDQVDA